MTKYYLAQNYGSEGWRFESFDSIESLKQRIHEGNLYSEFKIFKELELQIIDNNKED